MLLQLLLLFHRCRYCCCCCCYSLSMTRRRPDCRGIHRTWDVTTASSNYLLFSFRHLPNLQRHKLLSTVCAIFLSYLEFMCVRQFKRVLHIMYTFSYASSLVSKKDSLPYRVAKMFSFVVQYFSSSPCIALSLGELFFAKLFSFILLISSLRDLSPLQCKKHIK